MRVKIKTGCKGFIGGSIRKEGEIIQIEEKQFSKIWMEKLEDVKAEEPKVEAKAETKKTK